MASFGQSRSRRVPSKVVGGETIARRVRTLLIAALLAGMLVGCYQTQKDLHYIGDASLQHYKDVATKVDYPVLDQEANSVALATDSPRRIRELRKDQCWDMSLSEALQIALQNAAVIRERDQFLSTRNPLMTNPEAVSSLYDPAIQESEVRFGSRGVEAALSDFDAQFTTSMIWGRNEQIQNNLFSQGLPAGSTLAEETGVFQSRLQKQFADSGSFAISQNWNYSLNNAPSRLFGSAYDGTLRAEYRRPLWARSGTEFTRISGPNATVSSGVTQGVVIARINNDITVADFEINMQNLLRDVENAYWDLCLAYHAFDTETVSYKSALGTWREVKARLDEGLEGGSAADEAQGSDNLFDSQARVEKSLADLYSTETQLRRLIGLTVNDGRIIRPSDEPTAAEFIPDWPMALAEAISGRTEVRRQKWQIKKLEFELTAARSLTKPDFDFVSGYQVNGFGDTLIDDNDNDGVTTHGLNSAYGTLTQGDQTGWNLGFEFRVPIGFRAGHAGVRSAELRLAKARAMLAAQELEASHELATAFQNLDRWYKTAQTYLNRRRSAERRVQATRVEYEAGRTTLDLVLRAQISLAAAEIAYFQSITEYNKAISEIHFRKGTLLEHNNVQLAEGIWADEAYPEALRRAWARSHAFDTNLLHTEPPEFVSPYSKFTPEVPVMADQAGVYPMQGTPEPLTAAPSSYGVPPAAPPETAPGFENGPAPKTPVPAPPLDDAPKAPSGSVPAPAEKLGPMASEPTLQRAAAPATPKVRIPVQLDPPTPTEVSEDSAIWRTIEAPRVEKAPARPMLPVLEAPVELPEPSTPAKSAASEIEEWRSRDFAPQPKPEIAIEPKKAPEPVLNIEPAAAKPRGTAPPTKRKLIEPPAKKKLIEPPATEPSQNVSAGPVIQSRPAAPSTPAPGLARPKASPTKLVDTWAPRDGAKKKPAAPSAGRGWTASGASETAPSAGELINPADFQSDLSIEPNPGRAGSNTDQLPDLPTYRWRGAVTPTSGQWSPAK